MYVNFSPWQYLLTMHGVRLAAGDKNKYHKWRVCVCRALCYLKLERFTEAKQDCDAALKMEPTNKKAFYRRALANKGLKVKWAEWREILDFLHPKLCVKGAYIIWYLTDTLPLCEMSLEADFICHSTRTTWHAALTCRRCCSRIPTYKRLRKSLRRSQCCSDRVWPTPRLHQPKPGRLSPSQRFVQLYTFSTYSTCHSVYWICVQVQVFGRAVRIMAEGSRSCLIQAALQALWNWWEDGLMAVAETYPCGFGGWDPYHVTAASSAWFSKLCYTHKPYIYTHCTCILLMSMSTESSSQIYSIFKTRYTRYSQPLDNALEQQYLRWGLMTSD